MQFLRGATSKAVFSNTMDLPALRVTLSKVFHKYPGLIQAVIPGALCVSVCLCVCVSVCLCASPLVYEGMCGRRSTS